MITAVEARRNVMTYCNNHIEDALIRLSKEIEEASKRGDSRIRVIEYNEEILKMIIKACRRKGYKVTHTTMDPMLYNVAIISWK